MIEVYTLIIFSLLTACSLTFGAAWLTRLDSWIALGPSIWTLICALGVYALLLPPVRLAWRALGAFTPMPAALQSPAVPTYSGRFSLGQPAHAALGIAVVGLLTLPQTAPDSAAAGLVTAGGVVIIGICGWRWYTQRQAPRLAGPVEIEQHASWIKVSWQPPDDDRYLRFRLVRTEPLNEPAHPFTEPAIYEGLLNSYDDHAVTLGEPYRYTVFALGVWGKFTRLTNDDWAQTQPPPDPPLFNPYTAERDAITLSWTLNIVRAGTKVRLQRYSLDTPGLELGRPLLLDPTVTTYRDSGLDSGVRIEYRLVTVDADGRVSREDALVAATLVAAPTLAFEVVRRRTVELSWTLPVNAAQLQHVVLTRQAEGSAMSPEIIYTGPGSGYVDNGDSQNPLSYQTTYIYTLQAHYAEPIRSELQTIHVQTRPQPRGISAESVRVEPTRRNIRLQWPLQPSAQQVRIAKTWLGGQQPAMITLSGQATEYVDHEVEPGEEYHYALSIVTEDGHESLPVQVAGELQPLPGPVLAAKTHWAAPHGPVTLTWQLPQDSGVSGAHIVRQQGRLPEQPDDGEIVHHGPGSQAIDSQPSGGRSYGYAFYTYAADGAFSIRTAKMVDAHTQLRAYVAYADQPEREARVFWSHHPIEKLVSALLKGRGFRKPSLISDWRVTIEETGRVIEMGASLLDAGFVDGQTLTLHFTAPPEALPDAAEQPERQSAVHDASASEPADAPAEAAPPQGSATPDISASQPAADDVTVSRQAAPAPMRLWGETGLATHTGRVRETNEDRALAQNLRALQEQTGRAWQLLIVADGMGGHAAGEVASRTAVDAASDVVGQAYLNQQDAPDLTAVARTALERSNAQVWQAAQEQGDRMGSTAALALIDGSRAVVANVGDSRAYLYRDGTLARITQDHSLVMQLVALGQISEQEIYDHPNRNVVLRSIGEKAAVDVDTFDLTLQPGDGLLLCSDGLWELVRDDQIAAILAMHAESQAACDALIEAANAAGGADNISAVLARFDDMPQP